MSESEAVAITTGQQWIDKRKRTRGRVLEIIECEAWRYFVKVEVVRDKDEAGQKSQVGKRLFLDKARIYNECRLLGPDERVGAKPADPVP